MGDASERLAGPGGSKEAQRLRRSERMDRLIALVVQGMSRTAARQALGIHERTYMRWREVNPDFASRIDHAAGLADGQQDAIAFAEFRALYFDHDTPTHHQLIAEAIESAPLDSITMILAPPEAAKTTLLVDYICWKLATDPNFRIAIVSEGQPLARKILAQVARRMTDEVSFPAYIKQYGPFKSPERQDGKPWNADAITVLRASHDEKEPSVESRGATAQIYGARYDLLLLDDIQSTTNIGETDKLVTHFRQTMLSRVSNDKGRTVILGSRVDKNDFYEKLLDEEDGELVDRLVRIRAIENGESYWPSYWPLERLERRMKKVGNVAWQRAYMQNPVGLAAPTFTAEILDAVKNDQMVIGVPNGNEVICAVDPALTGHTALVALGCAPQQCWLIDVDAYPGLGRVEEILNRMEVFTNRYRPSVWVVEIGAFQGALANDERLRTMAQRYHFTIVQHTSTRTKADPVMGVGSMASVFTLKEITVPYGNEESRRKVDALYKELLDWRGDVATRLLVQDRVMALWFAWRQWMQRRRTYLVKPRREWRPSWMQPTNGNRRSA